MLAEQVQNTLFLDKKIVLKTSKMLAKTRKVVFKPYSQNQQFLLPKNVDDFVSKGHIARLVSSVIDRMDIQFILDTYEGGGTSSYNPRMLLKAWILGFVKRVYSCRLVAMQLRENLAFIWISGNQTPDFHTLNNFRLRLKEDIKKVFKQIVLYGLEAGIIEGKDVFIDHTKAEANANKHKVVWKKQVERQSAKIDSELDELFKHIDKINEDEEKIFGGKDLPEQERTGFDKEKVQKIVNKINERVKKKEISREQGRENRKNVRRAAELLERKEEYALKKEVLVKRNSYSRTDTDAVAMMLKDKLTIRPAYNEGVVVENGFVLNYVVSDCAGDCVSYIPLMDGVVDNLGKSPENANSDGAYGNEENMSYNERRGINNYLKYNRYHKEKSKAWRAKKFMLEDLKYDNVMDEFHCDCGAVLVFEKETKELTRTGYVKKVRRYKACEGHSSECVIQKKRKTRDVMQTLKVSWKAERLKRQAKRNLDSEKGRELRKRRGYEMESVFGDQKLNKLKRRYHLRGLEKVSVEAGLYYISHNLRKMFGLKDKVAGNRVTSFIIKKSAANLLVDSFFSKNSARI
jgi:transposase